MKILVTGANTHMPLAVDQNVEHPLTLYTATKKATELMALFKFTANILAGKPIDVFNYGKHKRDFTYVTDIAGGVIAAVDHVAVPDAAWNSEAPHPSTSRAPYRLYNIGNQRSVELLRYRAQMYLLPLQQGDVPDMLADVDALTRDYWLSCHHTRRRGCEAIRRVVSFVLSSTDSVIAFERNARI